MTTRPLLSGRELAIHFARSLLVDAQDFAWSLFSHHDPDVFRLVFPSAALKPLVVPEDDMKRAMAILDRKARQRRDRTALRGV